jgi:hypothetical protein
MRPAITKPIPAFKPLPFCTDFLLYFSSKWDRLIAEVLLCILSPSLNSRFYAFYYIGLYKINFRKKLE